MRGSHIISDPRVNLIDWRHPSKGSHMLTKPEVREAIVALSRVVNGADLSVDDAHQLYVTIGLLCEVLDGEHGPVE